MKDTPKTNETQTQASMQNNMTLISPIMSGVIAFTVPAGLGLYWITGNVYQIVQQTFMNIFILKKRSDRKKKTANNDESRQLDTP
jgi:YidC/Oxa1 family membrane protein insertase